jgi:hypothetical protein
VGNICTAGHERVKRVTWHYPKDDKNQIGANIRKFILFIYVTLFSAGNITLEVSLESSLLFIIVFIKAISLQAWTSPEVSRSLRFPDFKTIGT